MITVSRCAVSSREGAACQPSQRCVLLDESRAEADYARELTRALGASSVRLVRLQTETIGPPDSSHEASTAPVVGRGSSTESELIMESLCEPQQTNEVSRGNLDIPTLSMLQGRLK